MWHALSHTWVILDMVYANYTFCCCWDCVERRWYRQPNAEGMYIDVHTYITNSKKKKKCALPNSVSLGMSSLKLH